MSFCQTSQEGLTLHLQVSPKASKIGWEGLSESGRLKLKISAPPVEGKANEAIVKWLSKEFKCPKSLIKLIRGDKSREKTFLLPRYDQEALNRIRNEYEA